MKKIVVLIVCIIILLGIGGYVLRQNNNTKPLPITSLSPTPTIGIIFPTGNENFTPGQTIPLQWTPQNLGKVQIFLINKSLESQGTSVSIQDRVYNISDSGTYSYTIPKSILEGVYKFEIGKLTSNYFMIGEETGNTQPTFCTASNLQALITESAGAGNIYGTLTLKNTSQTPCQINGNNYIEPSFQASNITISHVGQIGPSVFTLSPNDTVYSQIHYPNGPQCPGPIQETPISFSYKISLTDSVSFKDENGKADQTIAACASPTANTEVEIWGMSDKPITP